MSTPMRAATCLLLCLLATSANAANPIDSCSFQIPDDLSHAIQSAFPQYRPPLQSDNLPEDVAFNRNNGGTGCLGIATQDFDGDGTKDLVLALTSKTDDQALVVVALRRKTHWHLHPLTHWKTLRSRLYVTVEPPGHFERTKALTGPLSRNERQALECPSFNITVGETESASSAYCYIKGKWLHVAVSD